MYVDMNAKEDAITVDDLTSIVSFCVKSENEVWTISGKYGVIRVRKAPVARQAASRVVEESLAALLRSNFQMVLKNSMIL